MILNSRKSLPGCETYPVALTIQLTITPSSAKFPTVHDRLTKNCRRTNFQYKKKFRGYRHSRPGKYFYRLTATGLHGTAPLFEKLRDQVSLPAPFLYLCTLSPSSAIGIHLSSRLFLTCLPTSCPPLCLSLLPCPPSICSPLPSPTPCLTSRFVLHVPPFCIAFYLPAGPKKKRKVCWFARWPVVSTPLHMVTYHQSTPATRFAPQAPWIFMDRE